HGTRALPDAETRRAQASERHPDPARAAQARPQGRPRLDPPAPARPAGLRRDREGVRHAAGRPQVRPREGQQGPHAVPHPAEQDGVDYHFLSEEEFNRRVAAGEFVEHARYAGHQYGTLRSELERRVPDAAGVVLEIEVQGARQIRETMPEAVQVFIAPPSVEALRAR